MGSGISFGVTFNNFQQSTNQKDEIKNNLVLVCKVPYEGFPALRDPHIQAALNSLPAEVTLEDPQQPAALSGPEDKIVAMCWTRQRRK